MKQLTSLTSLRMIQDLLAQAQVLLTQDLAPREKEILRAMITQLEGLIPPLTMLQERVLYLLAHPEPDGPAGEEEVPRAVHVGP